MKPESVSRLTAPGDNVAVALLLVCLIFAAAPSPARAQPITSGHLNVGALSTTPGSQLSFVNAQAFVLSSGFVPMSFASTGTYAGFYGSGPSITALPQTVAHGGPNPFAPSLGAFIQLRMTLVSGPSAGAFAFWDTGATVPTFSLNLAGDTTPLWNLSGGTENPTAGQVGADPYGHIHGRRITATLPGEYVIGLQAFDTSLNGAQHIASDLLQIRFVTIPEPPASALLGMAGLATMLVLRWRR